MFCAQIHLDHARELRSTVPKVRGLYANRAKHKDANTKSAHRPKEKDLV
jgi:hypothetical protein